MPLLSFAVTNINLQQGGGETAVESGGSFFGHQIPQHDESAPINQELSQDELSNSSNETDEHNDGDEQRHISLGHYRNIAALSFTIILLGILASFRPSGWRLAAWVAGLLPAVLGIASLVLPNAESSFSTFWSVAAIAWGIVFIVVAEAARRKEL